MEIDGYELEKRIGMNSKNEEATGRARKRVSRACDRCRLKKDKCDALRPRCSPCIATNFDCVYDQQSKKRGLPEGYVRGLEKLWALSVIKIDGLEDAIRQIGSQEQNFNLWSNDSSGEVLHSRWKDSGVLRELESMLARTDQDTNPKKRKRDNEEDVSVEDSISAVCSLQPDFRIVPSTGQEFRVSNMVSMNTVSPHRDRLSLPNDANSILEHYFAYTHCWLPIVEKHQVMRTFWEIAKGQKRSDADLALLWAVLAYTSQQIDHQGLERTPAEMLAVVRDLIPSWGPFEPAHVQALVLLTLLNIGIGQWNQAYILVGIASRAGLQCRSSNSPRSKRFGATLQACCIFDTLIAGHLVSQPHLRRSDLQDLEYLEEDGSEDWEPWRTSDGTSGSSLEPAFTNSCFNRFFDVVSIMNNMLTCHIRGDAEKRMFFNDQRNALDTLERNYPATGAGKGMMPHHLLLRAFHLSAAMSISKGLFEAGATADQWTRSAYDVLELLSQQQQSPALGFRNVVPILEVPLHAASIAANASRPALETIPDLPRYTDFAGRMTTLVIQFSSTWAVFSPLASLLRTDTLTNGASLHTTRSNDDHSGFMDGQSRSSWAEALNDVRGPVTDQNAWPTPNTFLSDVIDPQLSRGDTFVSMSAPIQPSKQDGTDMSMSGVSTSAPAGLAMPAATDASPSFYGDEVDAIFHNLVHLDTTDWTNNREKGLADFGFADEDAFQAFCNDPDRLLATNNDIGQASFNASTDPWPPPGLFPGHFTETPDAQMEASQILQSLSGQSQSTVQASNRGTWWS
jgi:hypothetical protein